jgi:nicotinate-nucleotide pyrophosphorylase (carboxylating)
LDKYAVRMGGGQNHRMGLYDMVLIKDNHIDGAGGIPEAVNRVRSQVSAEMQIEVEVKNLDELRMALELPIQRIMLDNMNLSEMREAVLITNGKIPLEASGNVNLSTIREIAETGVDYISVGALTHSAPVLDLSMRLSAVMTKA